MRTSRFRAFWKAALSFSLSLCLIACGIPDQNGSVETSTDSPSGYSFVLPNIPAYPGAKDFSLFRRSPEELSLDPSQIVGDVQVITIQTSQEPSDHYLTVRDFYKQTLLSLGWTLDAEFGPASFYRRATENPAQEQALYVTVRYGRIRSEVDVELATFLGLAPIQTPTYTLEHQASWDGYTPFDMVWDGVDSFFVSDSHNEASILKLDKNGTLLERITNTYSEPNPDDKYASLFLDLALEQTGALLAVTSQGEQVVRILPDGQQVLFVENLKSRHIAVAPNGNIYLTDEFGGRIAVFDPEGRPIASWNTKIEDDAFEVDGSPWIAIDHEGMVYIADSVNNRIKKFDPSGKLLAAWGSEGHSPGRFTRPEGIAIAPNGLLYIVESQPNNRVQIFTPDGVLVGMWWPKAHSWEPGSSAQIYTAWGIAISADGDVVIADNGSSDLELLKLSELSASAVSLPTPQAKQTVQPSPSELLQTLDQEQWEADWAAWLHDQSCRAACWAGITPGKTKVSEAIELLKQHPLVDPSSVTVTSARDAIGTHGFDPKDYPDALTWNWLDGGKGFNLGGIIYFDRQGSPPAVLQQSWVIGESVASTSYQLNQTVYAIHINLWSFHPDPSVSEPVRLLPFSLADAQSTLGEPSHILATVGGASWYTQSIIYADKGLILLQYGRQQPDLQPEWRPSSIILSDQVLHDGLFRADPSLLQPWRGIQSFEAYCRPEAGNTCEVTENP
jgi:Uncharacterized conserved protein